MSAQLAEHQAFWAASVLPGGAQALCPRGAVATGEHAQLADLFWREPGNGPRASVIGVDHEYCHSLGRYRGSNPAAASAFCSVHRPRSSGFTASSLDDTSHIPAWSIHFTSAYRAKLGASRNVPAKPATRIPKRVGFHNNSESKTPVSRITASRYSGRLLNHSIINVRSTTSHWLLPAAQLLPNGEQRHLQEVQDLRMHY